MYGIGLGRDLTTQHMPVPIWVDCHSDHTEKCVHFTRIGNVHA